MIDLSEVGAFASVTRGGFQIRFVTLDIFRQKLPDQRTAKIPEYKQQCGVATERHEQRLPQFHRISWRESIKGRV